MLFLVALCLDVHTACDSRTAVTSPFQTENGFSSSVHTLYSGLHIIPACGQSHEVLLVSMLAGLWTSPFYVEAQA